MTIFCAWRFHKVLHSAKNWLINVSKRYLIKLVVLHLKDFPETFPISLTARFFLQQRMHISSWSPSFPSTPSRSSRGSRRLIFIDAVVLIPLKSNENPSIETSSLSSSTWIERNWGPRERKNRVRRGNGNWESVLFYDTAMDKSDTEKRCYDRYRIRKRY